MFQRYLIGWLDPHSLRITSAEISNKDESSIPREEGGPVPVTLFRASSTSSIITARQQCEMFLGTHLPGLRRYMKS